MTKKGYSILHAKVHELESILDELLLLGPDTQSHHSISKDIIKQKLDFISNLLSAEVASHPSNPHPLHHISHRLEALDKAFHQWDTSPPTSHDFDKDSTCSLITDHSRFSDDVAEKALVEFNADKEIDKVSSFVYEDAQEEEEEEEEEEECFQDFVDGDKEFQRNNEFIMNTEQTQFGTTFCALLLGPVIAMGLFIMLSLSHCDQTFPIPT